MTESPFSEIAHDQVPHDPKARDKEARVSGAGLAWLGLLVALLALAASGWQWWRAENSVQDAQQAAAAAQQNQQVQQLEKQVGDLQSKLDEVDAQEMASRVAALERESAAQGSLRDALQTFQAETAAWTRSMQASIEGDQARIAGLESRLAALAEQQVDTRAELDLAEIDYVLRLAQERLQLFGDSRSADRALALADQQVAGFDNPMFIGLRREIASARERLAAIDQPDIVALNSELDEVQSSLATLQFRGQGPLPAAQAEAPATRLWWERLKGVFSGLVTVRRDSELESVTPVLADQEAIRQNAWLQLDLARLAVMRRDQPAYAAALGRCSAIVQRWFETSDANTAALVQSLARLQALDIDPALPDISAPWTALQAIRAGGLPAPSLPSAPASANGDESAAETRGEAADDSARADPIAGESGR